MRLGVGFGLLAVLLGIRDALHVGVELGLTVLGALHEHGLLPLGASEVLGRRHRRARVWRG